MSAPIALFCFNRPEHLRRTLASLQACDGFEASDLHVYSDGARNEAERPSVMAVRDVLARHLPASATVIARESNVGLAVNIIEGTTDLSRRFGRVITIEDDLLLDPRFLRFMNDALERYANQPNVFQVAGHMFESPALAGSSQAVALPWPSSWGWATWKRAWAQFDAQATGWQELATEPGLRRRFNLDGAYDYTTMLERQMKGEIQSWAVRWYWSVFRAGGLTIYPPFNLVTNIGFDGQGTHGRGLLRRFGSSSAPPAPSGPIRLREVAALDPDVCRHVLDALRRDNGGRLGRVFDRLRRLLWLVRSRG